jgi:cytosine/adenosine deaminase-related metal-dependent hydrolase
MGGARALHREEEIGSLEPGKKADIVVVSTKGTSMYPIYDYYSALVYSAGPSDVETVIADGRIVLDRKRVVTFDTGEVKREAERFVNRLKREISKLSLS